MVGNASHGTVARWAFLAWGLVACPAIGFCSWWIADPPGDTASYLLLLGLPGILALGVGAVLRQSWWLVVGMALLSPAISYMALIVMLLATGYGE